MTLKAYYWIHKLGLIKHPEGGFYRETYRSSETVNNRSIMTSIYYLLDGNQFSTFHRVYGDEIWHFYYGSSLTLYIINERNSRQQEKF